MWTRTMAAVTAVLAVLLVATPTAVAEPNSAPDGSKLEVTATFEGNAFDIHGDWGDARHCVVVAVDRVECFRTRTEASVVDGGPTDADLALLRTEAIDPDPAETPQRDDSGEAPTVPSALSSGCTLTLFENSYFAGSSISFSSTGVNYAMASYGFDQRASSWTEPGGCSAEFWDIRSGLSYVGHAGPYGAGGDCCLWNNYWDTGGTIDDDISYVRMN